MNGIDETPPDNNYGQDEEHTDVIGDPVHRKWYQRLLVFVPAICAVIAVILLFQFVFYFGFVPSGSMEPTIPTGSVIFGTRIYGDLKDGDIIVFNHDGKVLVKRIAAGPGETIDWTEYPQTERDEQYTVVPEDSWFVLGDNTENSADARYWDDPFIQTDDIIAKLFFH